MSRFTGSAWNPPRVHRLSEILHHSIGDFNGDLMDFNGDFNGDLMDFNGDL